ncbi:two-partner secretion domain-containing protein [Pseudomonas asplenii]|uniref:two-partner secretion domain-containing protein n=1 Tax=Pseudomonas asplenii TaxID=53407 RepID=UPI002234CCB7|nr:filamentous hemagglutinin N-terminal domain-containing protein [Pseudomonas asplenii]UZE31254.1 filamentous hemagglutinin N-terminal domain-containing protein [Pseudomonas asplenii]
MDVRQFAFLVRQPSATLKNRDHFLGLPKRGLAFLLANVMFWQPLWAQADGIVVSAPGTTLGQAGNGVPIVNIAAPNASGLSHNQFHDYNVGTNGVILNNATGRTQSTQLGGIILGNPNFQGAAATTILNEVNGGSPSQLSGYTEVAGQSAHVIVANPYGISCNGCGFINTPQATLTTGKAVITNGQVSGYQVDQGSVSIDGAGLNANNIDQFEIITRAAILNAQINANKLSIITGANDVDAQTLQVTARTANPNNAPQLAIDSSALGGMYAGAIKLVGTEAGVGVKLDGKMVASGGDIQLDANGHLSMVDTAATGAVNVKAQSLEAKGPVYAGTTLDVTTQGDLTSQNNLVAKDRITLSSGGQLTNNGIIEAGVNADNSRNATGDVSVTAQNVNNAGKSVIASRDLKVTTTQTLNNQDGTLSAQRQTVVTDGTLDNQNQGRVLSADSLNLSADTVLNGQGGLINSVGQLTATLGHLNNNGGEVSSKSSSTLILGAMDNLTGLVMAENILDITATGALNNQNGLISGWQGLTVNGTSLDNRNSGTVSSRNGDVAVTLSGALLNSHAGAVVSQKSLTVTADSLDNSDQGVLSSAEAQKLTVTGLLDNTQSGSITSSATLTLQAMALNNGGTVSANDALSFTGTDLDNSYGTFTGNAGVTLDLLGTLTNHYGKLSSAGPLLVQRSAQINNQNGGINSQGLLTLLTGGLDNSQQGTIGAADTLLITASGNVDNSADGLIASRNADLQLNAASLGNSRGSLQGKGAVTLDVTGDVDNQSGKVIAQEGDLTLTAANLDSRGGLLSSVKGAFESHIVGVLKNGYDLSNNNQGGTIQAQRLALNAFGGIDNNGGRIAAQAGDAVLDAGSGNIDNRNGGLYASNRVQVSGTDFDNSGSNDGQISGNQINLVLQGALNNTGGIVESQTTLTINAASLNNQNGQLRALGKSSKTVFSIGGLLDNSNGRLETANTDLGLDAGSFQNQGGSLLHAGTGLFAISMANLSNVGGQLVTYGDLTLNADSWTNSSSIQADHLTVNVNHLTQTAGGQLLASTSLTGSGATWGNDGLIGSDGTASLVLSGGYAGKGRLSSLGTLGLHAAQLDLDSAASVAGGGSTTINIDGILNNSGRLTSAADMTVTAASINNYGTLGSAQKLTATTGALLNDHGLIFSGGDMGLRVDSLTNSYASVYSLGNLVIDRDGQGALASSIVNSSGSLQSDGSMSLAASTIRNVRAILNTSDQGIYTASISEVQCIEGYNAGDCRGKQNHVWQIVQRDRFEVTEASAASSITAGSSLTLLGGDLLNQSSTIAAGGALTATLSNLTNSGLETGETETSRTFLSERTNDAGMWYDSAASFNDHYSLGAADYNPNNLGGLQAAMSAFIAITESELGQFRTIRKIDAGDQSYAAVIQAGGAVNVTAQGSIDSSVVRPGYTYVGSGPRTDTQASSSPFSTFVTVNQQLPPDLAQQQVNPVSLPGFSLPTGSNGLFRLSGQTDNSAQAASLTHVAGLPDTSARTNPQKYLIETNPALTDLKQFMSSDYLLSNLGYDPDTSAKRLGDGFYEEKLIDQAVVARTGQRFIDGQTSDDGMFKYLMNNAVESKQELNLQLGVSLTSEQVAALTHDIVWMENETVNGEQVLVPVLYLANANNRLAANGALVQGSDVNLIAGKDLTNAGTLRASSNLTAAAGNDLVNSGLLEAGNRLDALAGNDLTNKAGGIIAGRDVGVTAVTGDVINERTLTTHQSGTDAKTEQRTFADNAAAIEATQSLTVTAGRDIDNVGSTLKSGTDTTLKAGRDVNITSAEEIDSNTRGDRNRDQSITQDRSSVSSGGNLTVNAGRDLTAVASQIDAKGDLSLAAAGDLTLASAANEEHDYSKTKKVTSQHDHVSQVATSVSAGGNVRLSSGTDMTLVSSQVNAGHEAYLVSGGKLDLLAAQDSDYSLYDMKKRGAWGSKKTQHDEVTQVTNVGSQIKAGGDIGLISSGDQHYQAAKLDSGNDLTLQSGGAITFEGVKDLHKEDHAKSNTNLAWNTMKGKGSTDETLKQTEMAAKGQVVIKAVDGLHIDVKQVNEQTVSQAIDAMVQADPQLAWLKDAEKRGDVDWRQIKELHDSYKYSNSSLGAGAMLAIIIIVTVLTAGTASTLVASAGESLGMGSTMAAATTATATSAATSAGLGNIIGSAVLTSMAGTGAVSVINNKGNLGAALGETFSADSLKNAAISGLTAGAISYADSNWFKPAEGAPNGGSQVITAGPVQNPGYSSDMLTWGNATDTLARSGAHAVISSGISTAIKGGSFSSNLGSALASEGLDLAAAVGNKGVGDLADALHVEPGTATTMLLHATLGGLLSVAKGQDFTSGAIAGGVADGLTPIANGLLAQYASDQFAASDLSQEGSQKKIATAQIIGLLAASLAGGDPSTGSMIGGAAEKYNDQSHLEKKIRAVLALLSGSQPNAGFENEVAAQDPVAEFDGMGMPIDRSPAKTPASQLAITSALLMAALVPEVLPELLGGSSEGVAASLPRAGGLFSEVGEGTSVDAGAGGGNTAATSEGGVDTAADAKDAIEGVPGRVQSRVNLADDGIDHVAARHLSGKANASQFSIQEPELRSILQSDTVVSTPITRTIDSADGVRYVREVDVGHSIGVDKFNGGQPTSVMTVLTDKFGNLVTAFPGVLK